LGKFGGKKHSDLTTFFEKVKFQSSFVPRIKIENRGVLGGF